MTQKFKETMLGLAEEDSEPQRNPERADTDVTTSRVIQWLAELGAQMAEEPMVQICKPHLITTSEEEEAEEVVLPDKHGYRRVVFDSEAYKTLVVRIVREATLTFVDDSDAMRKIRSNILRILPNERRVSRHLESKAFTMMLHAAWDPATFLRNEYQVLEKPDEILGRVITLTGSMNNAQALPASDYLKQTWPATGSNVLAAIAEVLRTGERATSM